MASSLALSHHLHCLFPQMASSVDAKIIFGRHSLGTSHPSRASPPPTHPHPHPPAQGLPGQHGGFRPGYQAVDLRDWWSQPSSRSATRELLRKEDCLNRQKPCLTHTMSCSSPSSEDRLRERADAGCLEGWSWKQAEHPGGGVGIWVHSFAEAAGVAASAQRTLPAARAGDGGWVWDVGWRWAEGQGAWLFSGCSCPEAGVDPSLCGSPSLPCPLRCCLPDLGQPGEGPRGLPIYTGGLTAPDTAPSLRRWPSGPSTTVSALQTPGRGARAPRGLWAAGGTGTGPGAGGPP